MCGGSGLSDFAWSDTIDPSTNNENDDASDENSTMLYIGVIGGIFAAAVIVVLLYMFISRRIVKQNVSKSNTNEYPSSELTKW